MQIKSYMESYREMKMHKRTKQAYIILSHSKFKKQNLTFVYCSWIFIETWFLRHWTIFTPPVSFQTEQKTMKPNAKFQVAIFFIFLENEHVQHPSFVTKASSWHKTYSCELLRVLTDLYYNRTKITPKEEPNENTTKSLVEKQILHYITKKFHFCQQSIMEISPKLLNPDNLYMKCQKKWQNFLEVKTNNNNDSQINELLFNKSQLKKNRSIFSYSLITNHILFKLSRFPYML